MEQVTRCEYLQNRNSINMSRQRAKRIFSGTARGKHIGLNEWTFPELGSFQPNLGNFWPLMSLGAGLTPGVQICKRIPTQKNDRVVGFGVGTLDHRLANHGLVTQYARVWPTKHVIT